MTEITDGIKMDSRNDISDIHDSVSSEFQKTQLKHMRDAMKSMFDSKYGEIFRQPVDPERDNLPDYFEIIKNPIDLSTILKKIESSEYESAGDVVDDFYLMIRNCLEYNPDGSLAHRQAKELERLFSKRMSRLPKTITLNLPLKRKSSIRKVEEVSELKESKGSCEPRELRAKSKKILSPLPSQNNSHLLLDPQINSDKTFNTSQRDKIVTKRSLRDNYDDEKVSNSHSSGWQAFCQQVVGELCGKKHQEIAFPFLCPVDPIAQNIPDYFDVIKNPIDLGTIRTRLKGTYYINAKQVVRDVRLVFSNCYRYNSPETDVYQCAEKLHNVFERLVASATSDLFYECLIGSEDANSDILSVEAVRSTRRSHFNENKQFTDICHGIDKKLQLIIDDINKIKNDRSSRAVAAHGENGQYILKKTTRANQFNLTPLKTTSTPPILPKVEPQKVEDCDPMTYDEKLALSSQIMCLSEQKIKEVVALINQREPWSRKMSSKEKETVEVDLDSLQPMTLRAIEKYIVSVTKKKTESITRKKCTTEERASKEQQLRSKLHIMESQLAGTVPITIGNRSQIKSAETGDKTQESASRLSDSSESEISDDEFSRRYSLKKPTTTIQGASTLKRSPIKNIQNGSFSGQTHSLSQSISNLKTETSESKTNIEKMQESSSFINQLVGGESTTLESTIINTQSCILVSRNNDETKISHHNNEESLLISTKYNICETKLNS